MRRSKLSFISVTLLGFITGIVLACLTSLALTSGYGKAEKKAGKDTVFVKLLDSLVTGGLQAMSNSKMSSDSTTSSPNRVRPGETKREIDFIDTGSRYLEPIQSLDSNFKAAAYDEQVLIKSTRSKALALHRKQTNYILQILSLIVFAFFIVALVRYSFNRELLLLFAKEQLPAELQKLAAANKEKILDLETPRKRKRFENRLRFQYSYLNTKGVLNTEADLNCFIDILLLFEKNPKMADTGFLGTAHLNDRLKVIREQLEAVKPDYLNEMCTPGLVDEIIKLNIR